MGGRFNKRSPAHLFLRCNRHKSAKQNNKEIKCPNIYSFGAEFFSNFHPINGDQAFTSEKIFMAQKAMAFHDMEALRLINQAVTPRVAKKLGKTIVGFNNEAWEKLREGAMMHALHIKFAACEEFRDALRASGNDMLVEASPVDSIWGIGFDETNALANKDKWGLNLLGKCLMGIRYYYYGV